jgi:hypothetical protein
LVKSKDMKKGQVADILVLAFYEKENVTFLGWATKDEMRNSPERDFGYGIISHYKPRSDLGSLKTLEWIISTLKKGTTRRGEIPREEDDGWCEICALTPGMVRSVGCYKTKAGKECHKLNEMRSLHLLDAEGGSGGLLEVSSEAVADEGKGESPGPGDTGGHKLVLFPYQEE